MNFILLILALLELWYVVLPVALLLTFLGALWLPDGHRHSSKDGHPVLSFFCNVFVLLAVTRYFGLWDSHWVSTYNIVGFIICYLTIGVTWSFEKWRRVLAEVKLYITNSCTTWAEKNNVTWPDIQTGKVDDPVMEQFAKWLRFDTAIRFYKSLPDQRRGTDDKDTEYVPHPWPVLRNCLVPIVTEHKNSVITWMLCWPLSVLKWLLADLVTDLINALFNSVRRSFQNVANRSFNEL